MAVAGCHTTRQTAIPPVATFSIVAYDPETGDLGVAVQSRFLGVGAVVPWAKAGIGAVATQSYANTTYGPEGLRLMADGMSAGAALGKLTNADPKRQLRQAALINGKGEAAAFTGDSCHDWAGHRVGKHYSVQGNILAGERVVEAMAKAFEKGEGDLGDRMIGALVAGQEAGGDTRGKQSAALLIVRKGAGYAGLNDRYRDIRVDDHATPIKELHRIYQLHRRTFHAPLR
jgi:uncharacterized Ntn-hydrolase superfamily protein